MNTTDPTPHTPAEAHTMPARKHGSTGLVIDVSGIRTASTRRTA